MKDSHWPVFTNVKTNSRRVKFLSFRSFGNLLTSFCIGIAVSGLMLRLKAKEFSKDPEFKASLGWYQKWKCCLSVSLRTKTTLAQGLPEDLEQQTVSEFSGNRTVPVKSCGAEKRSFTVTLAVAADGKKLPPSVTFKGVRTPRDLVVPPSVKVYSSRQEESSFPKSGPSLDKASLERYSRGDGEAILQDLWHLQCT